MVINELLKKIENNLTAADTENAKFESGLIVRSVFGFDALALMMNSRTEADEALAKTALEYAARRAKNEPLEYILGTQEFMSLEFEVTPSVLIPRADTETLVEEVITQCRKIDGEIKILDIGAGSGCVGISIAHYCKNTRVTEIDISDAALSVAKRNAERLGTNGRMTFLLCDILTELPNTDGSTFDIIVSNPPYIETAVIDILDENVRRFEPHSALDGGADGLVFYRRIAELAPTLLKDSGMIAVEIGYDQGVSVSSLFDEHGFSDVRVIKDLCGNNRVVTGYIHIT